MTSPKTYITIFLALMVMTAITVWVAFLDLGMWNTPMALGIALFKAILVIVFFMHARHSEKIVWMFIVMGFYWLGIMMIFTFSDYLSRNWLPIYN
jgi:cytochrome c oxidase subunit IV